MVASIAIPDGDREDQFLDHPNFGILARSPRGVRRHVSPEVQSWHTLMDFSQISENLERRPGERR